MEIIPDLNLNKHPRNVKSGSLIDARNIMLTRDGVIVNEDSTDNTSTSGPNAYIINKSIYDKYFSFEVENPYEIIYCIECNIELVIFVKVAGRDNTLSIFRYNEELKQCKFLLDNFEYSGGKLVGDFLYNKENLIIAISEYSDDDSLMIPLRTINLGKFPTSEDYLTTHDFLNQEDINQFINPKLHPICPEIRIPFINFNKTTGIVPKGWHYIFIRYKISKDTYTKWLNTNSAIFCDEAYISNVINYATDKVDYISILWPLGNDDDTTWIYPKYLMRMYISTKYEYCNNNYQLQVYNIDNNFDEYQIATINITKDKTNCYISDDIKSSDTIALSEVINNYNITNIISGYNNYYNVKTLNVYENRIYIANYKEYKFDYNINIDFEITFNSQNSSVNFTDTYINYNFDNVISTNPNEKYYFYIHFVNKYGEISNGIPLNKFNVSFINNTNIKLDTSNFENNNEVFIQGIDIKKDTYVPIYYFSIHNKTIINNNTLYYFISYEKNNEYAPYMFFKNAIDNNYANLFSQDLNIYDSINLSFDQLLNCYNENNEYITGTVLIGLESFLSNNNINGVFYEQLNIYPSIINNNSKIININKKEITFADDYNNIMENTNIIISSDDGVSSNTSFCLAINNNFRIIVNNKTLIPCTHISNLNSEKIVTCNTKNSFISFNYCISSLNMLFNSATKQYERVDYKNTGIDIHKTVHIFFINGCFYYTKCSQQSIVFKNEPTRETFIVQGRDTSDPKYALGNIIDVMDLNDLFKQPQVSYYDKYPIYYTNYKENNTNVYNYTKTLRRSNVIADESDSNNFRFFEQNNYKNLNANKGEIIKLFGIANILMVHCQYSLFIFNKDNSINSQNGSIQLSAVDIWDIDYKDMFPDRLGYGGLQNINDSINSFFGYIWYDRINKEFYRLDGANKITRIDYNITNFIKNITIQDICFGIDNKRERLLISFKYNNDKEMTLSYHYNINMFISVHDYHFNKAWITNYNLYMLSTRDFIQFNTNDKCIFNGFYDTTQIQESYIRVIATDEYDAIKMIDSISYKLSLINKYRVNIDDFIGADNKNNTYAGDIMRIYNRDVDTGDIDLSIVANNVNSIENYNKPYYYLGNWNINLLRDKLNEYKQNSVIPDSMTRLYGNYFIVEIRFTNVWPVEIESIYINYSKIN